MIVKFYGMVLFIILYGFVIWYVFEGMVDFFYDVRYFCFNDGFVLVVYIVFFCMCYLIYIVILCNE